MESLSFAENLRLTLATVLMLDSYQRFHVTRAASVLFWFQVLLLFGSPSNTHTKSAQLADQEPD
jgi:hypothetical protein